VQDGESKPHVQYQLRISLVDLDSYPLRLGHQGGGRGGKQLGLHLGNRSTIVWSENASKHRIKGLLTGVTILGDESVYSASVGRVIRYPVLLLFVSTVSLNPLPIM
jgi:hypothetical protein